MSLTSVSNTCYVGVVTAGTVAEATTRVGHRREAQRLATREKLLEISVLEFRRRGFAHTEIATIVERAGVSRGTFYFHFPTKEDVLEELRMREERRIVRQVAPLAEGGESLETVLRTVVSGILEAEDRLGRELVRDICAVQFRPGVADSDTVANHPVAQFVLSAVARASKPPRSAQVAQARADVALIFLVGMFGLLSTRSPLLQDRDRLIDALVTLTLKGVTAI